MDGFGHFLFPTSMDSPEVSVFLLLARIVFGGMLLSHGLEKLMSFKTLSTSFPAQLGMSSKTTLMLAIFAEFFCSIAFICGFLYRLAMLPMLFTMFIAFFVTLRKAPFLQRELPLVYLLVYIFLYVAGPGRYAIDYLFAR